MANLALRITNKAPNTRSRPKMNCNSKHPGTHPLQHTLARWVTVTGNGLHSGRRVELSIGPAQADTGIVFERRDLPGRPSVEALPENIVDSVSCTALEKSGARVSTVEHLLAAFRGLGVDNAHVILDGEEVPILDGSASPFVRLLKEAGLRPLDAYRSFWRVRRPVVVQEGDRSIRVLPARRFSIDCTLDFDHPLVSDQRFRFSDSREAFEREIAPARTFGFLKDVKALRQSGLALGGSLSNSVVVASFSILNREGLRFPDEFARHKVLDILGDLALLGSALAARVVAVKSGHRLHCSLIRRLAGDPSCCTRVQLLPGDREAELPFETAAFGVRGLQGA